MISTAKKSFFFWMGIALALCVLAAEAQEMPVPVEIHFPLLRKMLAYDRAFLERNKGKIVIGILYQEKYRRSLAVAEEIAQSITHLATTEQYQSIEYRLISLDEKTLSSDLSNLKVSSLYVAPLRSASISSITDVTRTLKIPTITGVPEYVDQGIGVGIGSRANKPLILVNLAATKAEGSDYSAQLLRLAKVIQ
jgi:hypothetical protein